MLVVVKEMIRRSRRKEKRPPTSDIAPQIVHRDRLVIETIEQGRGHAQNKSFYGHEASRLLPKSDRAVNIVKLGSVSLSLSPTACESS